MKPALLALVVGLGGCSAKNATDSADTGVSPAGGPYTAEVFIEDAAQAWCGAVRSCDPETWEGTHASDQSTCLAAERTRWEAGLDAMSCDFDVDAAVDCINALATTTCEDWETGVTQMRCEAVTRCP